MSLLTTNNVHLSTCSDHSIKVDHMIVAEGKPDERVVFCLDFGDSTSTRTTIFATREQLLEIEHACSVALQEFDYRVQEDKLADAAAELARQEDAVNYDLVSEGDQESGVDLLAELPDVSNGIPFTTADFRGCD